MAIYISDSNGILKKVAGAGGGSSGESIVVDSVLNSASANPVQNKALYNPVTFAENERKKSKNLLNLGNKTETINGVTVEVANSKITMSGAPSNIGDIFIDIPEMTLKANKTYIYSIVVLNGKSKGSEPIPYTTSSIIIPNQAFTLTSDLVLNKLQIYMLNTQNQDVTFGVQIEEGSAITEWEDFSGKILHEIDLNEYYNKSEVDNKIDNIPETDLSEYYTKSETVSEIVNNINVKFAESEREKSETDGAIVHENTIQGMAGVVLWSNPSPKSSFSSQTITLSSGISNFDYLMLEYEAYIPANEVYNCRQYSYFKPIINGSAEFLSGGWDSGTRYIKARALKVVSETQIEFADGYQEDVKNDRMVVPMRILGIKKGV